MTLYPDTALQNFIGEVYPLTLLITIAVAIVFFVVVIVNRFIMRRVRKTTGKTKRMTSIMQHAIELGSIDVVRFQPGTQTVYGLYGGIIPEEGVSMDEFFTHIHTDDQSKFAHFIQQLENRDTDSAECNCRLSKDPAKEQWHDMRCQAVVETGTQPVSIICTMTDETSTLTEEQAERSLTDRYRLIFDQSIVGMTFYDKSGMLLGANQYIRKTRHFQGENDPFYFNVSLFELPTYRDVLNRNQVEDLYFCTREVIPERGVNSYMEIRLHPILDDMGQLLYISECVRDITEERDLYLKGKRNDEEIRRANESIILYESELKYLLENCQMLGWHMVYGSDKVVLFKELSKAELTMTTREWINHFLGEDNQPAQRSWDELRQEFSQPSSKLYKMSDLYGSGSVEWYVMNTVPEHDKEGRITGQFGLIRRVTPLINAQNKLKRETERANDSGRLKSVFMANMTHEIRTPLNSIVGFSDLLPMIESPDDKREMIKVIMNNCDMLLRLINDILDISTMDSQAITMEPVDADFAVEFDKISKELSERVQEPLVEFLSENPYDSCPVCLDIERIRQIVTNFVTNAVKYTHEGHIKIGYRLEDRTTDAETRKGIYIYCEDTGSGIPKEKQSSIFERFVKLNDYVQGTGLGLSICKAIAQKADGQIGVESEGENCGSTFWVWLPTNPSAT